MLALAVELCLMDERAAATALVLGFDCYLRHGELRDLRWCDVAFPGDARLMVARKGAVYLRKPKSGRPQFVQIRDPLAVRMLRRLSEGQGSVSGRHSVFELTNARLLRVFKQAQVRLGFQRALFVIHSVRHGSATHDFLHKILDMNGVMHRGRWAGLPCTRIYIQESQAAVLGASFPPVVTRRMNKRTRTASVLCKLLGV
jgi:integrase